MADTKELLIKIRKRTGAGVMDIKEALDEAQGDEEKTMDLLRKKGQKIAAKRAERSAGEGWVGSYVHSNGKIGTLVKLQCETDFVARNAEFQELANGLAMHVAAMNPMYLTPQDVPTDVVEKEKAVYAEEVAASGKPANVVEKIIEGKLQKFYSEVCLVKQAYVKDDSETIEELIVAATAKIGEKVAIGGFTRVDI